MIEQHRTLLSPAQNDLDTFQQRASQRRQRFKQSTQLAVSILRAVSRSIVTPIRSFVRIPSRYLLHLIIALVVPVALVLSQVWVARPVAEPTPQPVLPADAPDGLGPISLEVQDYSSTSEVGDPPLEVTDALPMPLSLTSRREALAPLVVPAPLAGGIERVKLRNGPGLEYDEVARMDGGTPMQVIGRVGDWFQVRENANAPVYWVAGELLDLPEASVYTLFEVPQSDIPPPPPPKVGMVRESNLNLRDGPGTNYVSMQKVEAGMEVSLVEQYQGWMHVATDSFDGWVSADFLDIGEGILHRVPEAETIPDPNPALMGIINAGNVNLRKGPGTAYPKAGTVGGDTQVDLLARHKEWYRVQLSDGSKVWIFGELLNIAPMAQRRVPYTNDIPAVPAPPRPAPASRHGASSRNSGNQSGGNVAATTSSSGGNFVSLPASGDVAGFAMQFVGHAYVWGGSGPGGFDCSGLTRYVYRQYGVGLPHSAAGQYSTAYGAMVGMNSLAPGDLVFFVGTGGGYGITHVAIYVGGGRIVHAMTPGLGVQVSNLYSSYWQSHYYGALRVYR